MTDTEDKPTLAERYGRAINSSDLRVRELRQSDADVLIAAGWTRELGTLLYRLAAEYDQVKGDVLKTAANDQTGVLLILMNLKTLNPAKEAIARYALEMATKRRFSLDDKTVTTIAGHCLIAWLDPICHGCGGRGFNGGYNGRVHSICRACKGTGKHIERAIESAEQRAFAAQMKSEMKRMFNVADGRLRKFLKRD